MGDAENTYGIFVGNPNEEDHVQDLHKDMRIILKLIFRYIIRAVSWIYLVLDRHRRRTIVNTVMDFRVP